MILKDHLLLLGCSLLGGLLGSRLLLGGGFLGGGLLSGLLGSGLLGLLGGGLLCHLLGSGLLGGLLGSGLLDLLDLLGLLNLDQLVAASVLALSRGHLEGSLGDSPLEGEPDLGGSLGSIDLVVGDDVLEDGGTAGAGPVLEGGDGGSDHHAVLGVGGRSLLGLGSSGSRHVVGGLGVRR